MTRTPEDILKDMNKRAEQYDALTQLESNDSAVQVWAYAKHVMALGVAQAEHAVDQLRAEIRAIINKDEPGGIEWYRKQAFAWQHGDRLIVVNNRPGYLTLKPAAQIIKQVSVTESSTDGSLTFKVAKQNAQKEVQPLNEEEIAGFTDYLNRVKLAGTLVRVESRLPDDIRYAIVVEADPAVFTQNAAIKTAIYNALDAFHQSIEFNTVLYLSKVTDALQKIPGITDVEITRAEARASGSSFSTVNRRYEASAGYVKLNKKASSVTLFRNNTTTTLE